MKGLIQIFKIKGERAGKHKRFCSDRMDKA